MKIDKKKKDKTNEKTFIYTTGYLVEFNLFDINSPTHQMHATVNIKIRF